MRSALDSAKVALVPGRSKGACGRAVGFEIAISYYIFFCATFLKLFYMSRLQYK